MSKLIGFCALILLLLGCRETVELPPATLEANSPVFSVSGLLNGTPFIWQAGINGRYMSTSLSQDANGLYDLSGKIEPSPCLNCTEVLTVSLRDFRNTAPGAPMQIDSTFQLKSYPFERNPGAGVLFNVPLNAQSTGATATTAIYHLWTINDSAGSPVDTVMGLNPSVSLSQGNYRVSLTSQYSDGCSNTIQQQMEVKETPPAGCTGDFTVNRLPGTTLVQFVPVNINFSGSFSLRWEINGQVSFGQNATIVIDTLTTPEVFPVILTITSPNCTVVVKKNISSDPRYFCAANFRVGTISRLENPSPFGQVRLHFIDAQGRNYSSAAGTQPNWANFTVTALTTYLTDQNGKATKAITATADCLLFEEAGNGIIELRTGDLKIALPYQ